MDANAGMHATNKVGEKLSGNRLSSVDETIDYVVNNYSIGDELCREAKTKLSVAESTLPTDTSSTKLPKGNGGSSEDENNAKPMNEEEKMRLNRGMCKVYGPSMKRAINIIESREGSCETNRGEFELDLNKFQPSTLRALETYIASVVGEKHYYKKIAITREQRAEVRHKRKLKRLKKQLQEVTESSWYSESSDSYDSFSTNTTDSEEDG